MLTVDIIGSRIPETPDNLANFMQKNNYTFPALEDLKLSVTRAYGVTQTPTNFLIDKNGIIRERQTGVFASPASFDALLAQLKSY